MLNSSFDDSIARVGKTNRGAQPIMPAGHLDMSLPRKILVFAVMAIMMLYMIPVIALAQDTASVAQEEMVLEEVLSHEGGVSFGTALASETEWLFSEKGACTSHSRGFVL